MSNTTRAEEAVFQAALGMDDLEQRNAMLHFACRNDPELRQRIESLLKASEKAGDFMQRPAAEIANETADSQPIERPGTKIGRYKLLEQVGEGGFGVVYMADQLSPIERRVALKIIKLGMDTKQVIARFEAERQALALMDHPNIAKILDAGTTDTGRPYFVMELVRGIPVTEFCDDRSLTTDERLRIYVQICSAVQHAHQKGIIHRDIKPSNILVSTNGDLAVPMVIDFGIAKATQGRLTDKTLFTQFRQFIGTPAYMSPEQAQMSAVDVDTRSDIYSLGVLLYELLTGKTPLDSQALEKAGYEEICRRIRQDDAPKPSKRISSLHHDELTTLAKKHGVTASHFPATIRGDLDWIVMKAVEKDRTRRYTTADALAQDVFRYLKQEAVSAVPPSSIYRLRKFARRNKTLLITGATIVTILVGATIVLSLMYHRQGVLLDLVEQRRVEAERLRFEAVQQKQVAVANLHRSLVDEARSLRLARVPGYRNQAWGRLATAMELEVPHPVTDELRHEVVASLGDFVGNAVTWPLSSNIRWAALHPSGHVIALSLGDGTVSLRKLPNGEQIARLTSRFGAVKRLGFSAAGTHLFTANDNGKGKVTIQVWEDVGDNRWTDRDFEPLEGTLQALAVSRTDVRAAVSLFSPDADATVVLWRPGDRSETARLGQRGDIGPLTFLPDGKRLAIAHQDIRKKGGPLEFIIWDLEEKRVSRPRLRPDIGRITALQIDPTQQHLVCAAHGGFAVFELNTFSRKLRIKTLSNARAIAFSPSGEQLAIVNSQDHRVYRWDVNSAKEVGHVTHGAQPIAAGQTFDGKYLAVWSFRAVRVWRMDGTNEKRVLSEYGPGVSGLAYSQHDRRLASVDKASRLRIWDVATNRPIRSLKLAGRAQAVSFSPHRNLLAASDYSEGLLQVWDSSSWKLLESLANDCGPRVWSVAFSPDGTHFAAGGDAGVNVWRIHTEGSDTHIRFERLDVPRLVDDPLRLDFNSRTVAFSPNGRLFGWSSKSGVSIWDLKTGSQRPSPTSTPFNPIQNLCFLPDNRHVLFMNKSRVAEVWDTETGEKVRTFDVAGPGDESDGSYACKVALSPNGRWLAVSSVTGRGINIWDFRTGKLSLALPEESGTVWAARWQFDSVHLTAATANGGIITWNLDEVRRQLGEIGLAEPRGARLVDRPDLSGE